MKNKLGLDRNIPEAVRREVRRRSGYACVICRELICEYEHIDPEFSNASTHDPENICLLCPNCHSRKTRKRLTATQVREAYLRVNNSPHPPPLHQMDFSGQIRIILGNSIFDYIPAGSPILEYDGNPILCVNYVEDDRFGGFRPSISGELRDKNGRLLCSIIDNSITFSKDSFDIYTVGPKIVVKSSLHKISVIFTILPPNGLVINRLIMKFGEIEFDFDDNFGCKIPNINGDNEHWSIPELHSSGANSAISYISDRSQWLGERLYLGGEQGCTIPHTGLTFAKGASSTLIKKIAGKLS